MNSLASAVPRAHRRDLFLLGYLPAMTLIAWLLPEASWPSICAAATRMSGAVRRKRRLDAPHIEGLLAGRASAADADRIAAGVAAHYHETRLQTLRCHRFGSWRPRITLVGGEHVREALEAGKGGILWVAPFVFGDLVTKMAFHRAGFRVTHLSRPGHGVSGSSLGMRFLNPLWTTAERRYLAERLVMTPDASAGVLRELVRRVRENQLISITISAQGQRRHSAPFFHGARAVAGGAPTLAHRSGAALLPVFTVRNADGSFGTTVEPPLRTPPDPDTEMAVRHLVTQVLRLLESYVARWPDQYGGWSPSCPEEILHADSPIQSGPSSVPAR